MRDLSGKKERYGNDDSIEDRNCEQGSEGKERIGKEMKTEIGTQAGMRTETERERRQRFIDYKNG